MSQPTFALPDQLRYDMLTPSSLGCHLDKTVCTQYTGQGAVHVQTGNYFIDDGPKEGHGCVFDPMHSYLRFKLNLANSTNDVSITPPRCIDGIFVD